VGDSPENTVIERLDGSPDFRILSVFRNGKLTLERVTIRGGKSNARGGGIFVFGGELLVINCRVSNNRSARGGGISNGSVGTVINSVVTDNEATTDGGGILNEAFGTLILLNSTISNNLNSTLGLGGGGIRNKGGIMTLTNTTLSGNVTVGSGGAIFNDFDRGFNAETTLINTTLTANRAARGSGFAVSFDATMPGHSELKNSIVAENPGGDCLGPFVSLGHNLDRDGSCRLNQPGDFSGLNPLLGPLQSNGGPTFTHALLAGSPAINAGALLGCPASDQRGAIRPTGAACDIGAFEFGTEDLTHLVRSTASDRDNFHPGEKIDRPVQSPRVKKLIQFISADPGQGPGVDLDIGGDNRPVGLTHQFALPPGALMTSATVKFRAKVGPFLGYNDGIYYDQSASASEQNPDCYVEGSSNCIREPLLPVIVFRDLLRREPFDNEILELVQINLAKAPVRTVDTTRGPGGHWSAAPEEYRNLLSELLDGEWSMVFSDDTMVDWSELTITFVLPGAPAGDLTGDNVVDQNDLNIILGALNTPSYGPRDPRDLDGDGKITALDARKLMLLCTRPRCAVQ
jgi:hypothetical protein